RQPHQRQHAGLDGLHRRVLPHGRRVLLQARRTVLAVRPLHRVAVCGPPVLRWIAEEPATYRANDQHVRGHQVEDPDVGVWVQRVAEDEDERYCAIGESAVDKSGLAAATLRITLAEHDD